MRESNSSGPSLAVSWLAKMGLVRGISPLRDFIPRDTARKGSCRRLHKSGETLGLGKAKTASVLTSIGICGSVRGCSSPTIQPLKDCLRGTLRLGCSLRANLPGHSFPFLRGFEGNLRP